MGGHGPSPAGNGGIRGLLQPRRVAGRRAGSGRRFTGPPAGRRSMGHRFRYWPARHGSGGWGPWLHRPIGRSGSPSRDVYLSTPAGLGSFPGTRSPVVSRSGQLRLATWPPNGRHQIWPDVPCWWSMELKMTSCRHLRLGHWPQRTGLPTFDSSRVPGIISGTTRGR